MEHKDVSQKSKFFQHFKVFIYEIIIFVAPKD